MSRLGKLGLAFALAAGCGDSGSSDETYTVTGRVTSAVDDAPVASARVAASAASVVTDPGGNFALPGMRPGKFVRVDSDSYAPLSKPVAGREAVRMRAQPFDGMASIGEAGGELRSTRDARAAARFPASALAAMTDVVIAAPNPNLADSLRAISGDFAAESNGSKGKLSITSPLYLGVRGQSGVSTNAPVLLDFPAWLDADVSKLALFHYDEDSQTWRNTGASISANSATKTFSSSTSNLGWLALGEMYTAQSCVRGCAVDSTGGWLANAEVAATGTDHFSQALGQTDAQGCFQLQVRANARFNIEVRSAQQLVSTAAIIGDAGSTCTDVGMFGRATSDAGIDARVGSDAGDAGTNDSSITLGCGAETQACCNGTTCNANLTCSAGGTCECGSPSEPCCGGQSCDGPVQCNSAKMCACGGQGEACCPGTPANTCGAGMACTVGNRCGCIRAITRGVVQRRDGTLWSYLPELGPVGAITPFRINDQSNVTPFSPTTFAETNGTFCAIDSNKQAWCFGNNSYGIGTGVAADGSPIRSPSRVITSIAAGTPLADAETIGTGTQGGCATTSGGRVWCWGLGGWGQLGNGYEASSLVAVPVVTTLGGPQFDGVSVLAVGPHETRCAQRTDRTVWCWGNNWYSVSNPGSSTDRILLPTQITALQDRSLDVHVGGASACARMVDRTVTCWGFESQTGRGAGEGDRGLGTVVSESGAPLDNVDEVIALVGGYCALRDAASARSVWCWGLTTNRASAYLHQGLPLVGVSLLANGTTSSSPTFVDGSGDLWMDGSKVPTAVSCSN